MFTPESLLELAAESEAKYKRLLAQFPPGTLHDGRNEAHRAMEHALVCAQWMEATGAKALTYVGPFGSPPFKRGSRARVRKGATITSTFPGTPREGVAAKTSHVITVDSFWPGYVWNEGGKEVVHQPIVSWAGTGGYWRRVDANDVVLVVEAATSAAEIATLMA